MHIELIDLLRCPRAHEETWLVAAFERVVDRFIEQATLGCPVCTASYVIREGVVDLRLDGDAESAPAAAAINAGVPVPPSVTADEALSVAAMLNLTRPNSLIAISGSAGAFARDLNVMTECRVMAVNSPSRIDDSVAVARVLADGRLPFAAGSLDGVMLRSTEAGLLADVPRVLKRGGRLVTLVSDRLPPGIREIARDGIHVVGESVGELVTLKR
ncbi:MAG: hypothetical protein ABIS03_03690 [Gemmatimonadaceae bacterium]